MENDFGGGTSGGIGGGQYEGSEGGGGYPYTDVNTGARKIGGQ